MKGHPADGVWRPWEDHHLLGSPTVRGRPKGARLQLHAAAQSAILSAAHSKKQTQLCLFQKLHIVIMCSLGVMPPGQDHTGSCTKVPGVLPPLKSSVTTRVLGRPWPAKLPSATGQAQSQSVHGEGSGHCHLVGEGRKRTGREHDLWP